jgi:hypothetical protein
MGEARLAPAVSLQSAIAGDGFAFLSAAATRPLLLASGSLADWDAFRASWNDLALDAYMADGGRYRRRRHGVYAIEGDGIVRMPHQPHYQSLAYNTLNGGIARWFEPITDGDGASLHTILEFCRQLFGNLAPAVVRWHVEVHQFRIEARRDAKGLPTPEGLHRDGVDYVLVLLISRQNIGSGTTTIHGLNRQLLGSFTLTDPCDAALVDDARVFHGVTPVEPVDLGRPAYRDVLVVTFRRAAAGS